jgi:hypothetical protein
MDGWMNEFSVCFLLQAAEIVVSRMMDDLKAADVPTRSEYSGDKQE